MKSIKRLVLINVRHFDLFPLAEASIFAALRGCGLHVGIVVPETGSYYFLLVSTVKWWTQFYQRLEDRDEFAAASGRARLPSGAINEISIVAHCCPLCCFLVH